MVAAAQISVQRAGLLLGEVEEIKAALQDHHLPTALPRDFPRQKIFDTPKFDKKFESGQIRFVVTPRIGSANLSRDVTMEDIRAAVEKL